MILAVTSSSLPLLVAIGTTVFASVTGPLVVVLIMGRQQRRGKELDWEREDERDAQKKQEAEERMAETAAKLLAANGEVAARAAEMNGQTQGRLDALDSGIERVHVLVNSEKTAGLHRELVLMLEVIDLKRAAGKEPNPETLQRVSELRAELEDRRRQTEIAEKRGPE